MGKTSQRYHEGEVAAQRAAGEEEAARQNGAMIADTLKSGAGTFLGTQRMLILASRDLEGRPWASVVLGTAGFLSADDAGQHVSINRTMAYVSHEDPLWANATGDAPLGLLAIELATRRRLRVNGRVEASTGAALGVRVEQAYAICPKYIQRRRLRVAPAREATTTARGRQGRVPDAALLAAVREADTFFVASGHPTRGLDASHRGGQPGFVAIVAPDVFRIPDYPGNSMFNTFGNFLVDARCGLTLLDFERGRVHQMTGQATVSFAMPAATDDPADTGRSWEFRVNAWRSFDLPVEAEWEFVDYSPYNP